ncbi:hypothetical protein NQ315_014000 [Exocentrus adspersus]|uniref:Uncharacterized protein n=1 Tax=Exocentrus adspersus TaxID=1586481 RepID=A0AAV8VHB7_9CUCU|nr:hypothetical protein NQ315_014000 [Exocentrus adspersus]
MIHSQPYRPLGGLRYRTVLLTQPRFEGIRGSSDPIVKIIRDIYLTLKSSVRIRERDVLKYISYCSSNIRLFNALLNCDTTPQLKSKLQTNIGHLRNDRIRWEDGKSAFSSRIRSGLTINVLHTDPIEFLKDFFYLFKPRILNVLKKFPTTK